MSAVELPPDLIGQSALYNSPDPLLRRIRLEDQYSQSITDVDKFFRGKDLLVLYAGSEYGSQNLRELHRDLTSLAMANLKSLAVIYISTDTSLSSFAHALSGQPPWLRMIFHDNSDFAPIGRGGDEGKDGGGGGVEMETVERGEEFVQAGELEMGMEKVRFGVDERPSEYVRPLSRAAVTSLMAVYATPSLAIYHIPSRSLIAKNVRPTAFSPRLVAQNLRKWRNGGEQYMTMGDILLRMKWPLMMLVLAIIYRALVTFGGEQYNVLPGLIDSIGWRGKTA